MSTSMFVSMSTSLFMYMFRAHGTGHVLLMCSSALAEVLASPWCRTFEALFRIFGGGILPVKALTKTVFALMKERMHAEVFGVLLKVFMFKPMAMS